MILQSLNVRERFSGACYRLHRPGKRGKTTGNQTVIIGSRNGFEHPVARATSGGYVLSEGNRIRSSHMDSINMKILTNAHRFLFIFCILALLTPCAAIAQDKSPAELRKAAEAGNPEAQCNLGDLYAKGESVAQDNAEAVKWYRKAAAQGYALGPRGRPPLVQVDDPITHVQTAVRRYPALKLAQTVRNINSLSNDPPILLIKRHRHIIRILLPQQHPRLHRVLLPKNNIPRNLMVQTLPLPIKQHSMLPHPRPPSPPANPTPTTSRNMTTRRFRLRRRTGSPGAYSKATFNKHNPSDAAINQKFSPSANCLRGGTGGPPVDRLPAISNGTPFDKQERSDLPHFCRVIADWKEFVSQSPIPNSQSAILIPTSHAGCHALARHIVHFAMQHRAGIAVRRKSRAHPSQSPETSPSPPRPTHHMSTTQAPNSTTPPPPPSAAASASAASSSASSSLPRLAHLPLRPAHLAKVQTPLSPAPLPHLHRPSRPPRLR